MNGADEPRNAASQPENEGGRASDQRGPESPKHGEKPSGDKQAPKHIWLEFISRLGRAVRWLDSHDGLLTAIATVVIAIFTVVLAIYAGGQGSISGKQTTILDQQKNIMQGQLNELQSEQRPWVYVTPEIASDLTNPPGVYFVWMNFKLKNVGRLPAFATTIRMQLIPLGNPTDYVAFQKQICTQTAQENSSDSIVLFPGQEFPKQLAGSVGVEQVGTRTSLIFYLLGCVDYRLRPDGRHHQTWFGYSLVENTGEANEACCNVNLLQVPIPRDKMRLAPLTLHEVWYAD
jgi:hypothetical protein